MHGGSRLSESSCSASFGIKNMKYLKYVLPSVALLVIAAVICGNSPGIKKYSYEYHREKLEAESFLPEGFEGYEDIYYKYDAKPLLIFLSETITVKVKYSEIRYNEEKVKLTESCDFLAEPAKSEWFTDDYTIAYPEFECGGFSFRVAAGGEYPKKFGMVGTNDETYEIAYLWFCDHDLDYIGDSGTDPEQAMREFAESNFKI